MPGPARAGGFIYAKELARVAAFYEALLSMRRLQTDPEHCVLESGDMQLVVHAIPVAIANTFSISAPPTLREDTALKFFFTVADLRQAGEVATRYGGGILPQLWSGPGFKACNGFDCEGNVYQLREFAP